MAKQTEQIDRLYLELSQFTSATTEKEIKLARALRDLMDEVPIAGRKSQAWDVAVILTDCMPKDIFN